MAATSTDWRIFDGAATAWFGASSLVDGAALARRIVDLDPGAAVDLRSTGVRVRLASGSHSVVETAHAVSTEAAQRGLVANAGVLQQLGVVVETQDPEALRAFWRTALAYDAGPGGGLIDPLHRDPGFAIAPSTEPRPLRNRIHLDVVRPAPVVERVGLGEASGPYGVRLADPDGNEVDLVPGDALGEGEDTADWRTVFSAMACYRATTPSQQVELASAAASLATDAGFPLLIDLRPGLVIIDSGKDQWDPDAHGLAVDFAALAARIQASARELGATADPELPRFVQLFLDAADVDAVRSFWREALGYVADRRDGVSDLVDPRRLTPELVFQQLDAADTERRRQRNRLQLVLVVPPELVRTQVETALAAGGRLLGELGAGHRVGDPEGNELVIVAASERR